MRHIVPELALVTAILVPLSACESTLTGNEGNLQFVYDADDRVTDFNKPIAVGALLDLEVRDVGARQPVTLSAATFDDPAVLDVVSFADQIVTVRGTGDGQALLEVEGTTRAGEVLTDSVNLLSRVPEALTLGHSCTDGPDAAYLTSSRVWIPFDLSMANGQPVIGYGYYPVTPADPALSVHVSDGIQSHVALDLGAGTGLASLHSDIDSTVLDLTLVTAGDVDGVTEPLGFVWEDIDAGDTHAFYVLPSAGGLPVCQSTVEKQVTSDTPDICRVRDTEPVPDGGGGEYELGWFDVTGVAAGTCRFTVSYPAGLGGAGAADTFEVTIEP